MATPPKEPTQFGPDSGGERQRMLEDFLRPTVAALRGGLTIRENLRAYVTPDPITFTQPDDWQNVTVATGWTGNSAGEQRLQWRKSEDGHVFLRGRFTWTSGGAPTSGQLITQDPAWAVPVQMLLWGTTGFGASYLRITARGALQWVAGAFNDVHAASGLHWDSATREPAALPVVSQVKLPQVPFRPELVLVHATDAAGQERVAHPRWRAATQGIVLERIPGLVPLTRYSLMVYALAG